MLVGSFATIFAGQRAPGLEPPQGSAMSRAAVPDLVEVPPEIQRRARVRTITEPAYVRSC